MFGNKRKASKGSSSPASASKKKKQPAGSTVSSLEVVDTVDLLPVPSPVPSTGEPEPPTQQYCFKNPNFIPATKQQQPGKKWKAWKNLKQMNQLDRALPWGPDDPLYERIDAPPSFKPAKKYSDLSGLPSNYTDPHTKLRYATSDEFSRVGLLPSDIVSGLLQLRKANTLVP